jgi:hypothetical protein
MKGNLKNINTTLDFPPTKFKILNLLVTRSSGVDSHLTQAMFLVILNTLFLKKILTSKSSARVVPHYSKKLLQSTEIEPYNFALKDPNYSHSVLLNTIYELLNLSI